MTFQGYLKMIRAGKRLSWAEASDCLGLVLDDVTIADADIAQLLLALNKRTVTVHEICGFIDAMKVRMLTIPAPDKAIDTCGTGGDKSGTFNVSTAAALLAAAGGVPVAKHGNRAATSRCGSADVLEALGISIEADPKLAEERLQTDNFVFLFARVYHPALKRLASARQLVDVPTIFNLLGPLLNPAQVKRQVIGTFSTANAELLAQAISYMDYEHVIVMTSDDGLDEASLAAPVQLFEVRGQTIKQQTINASDYGLAPATTAELQGGDAAHNAQLIHNLLQPTPTFDAHQRIVIFNAALGFYVAGLVSTIAQGAELAQATLTNGLAAAKLKELRHEH